MITAILDTNVHVQEVISSPQSASVRTLKAYRDKRYRLVFSVETLDEFHAVLTMPTIRRRHGWSAQQINRHFTFLLVNSFFYHVASRVSASIPRDVTDTKFLELAEESKADYLVTNDRRHLLPLGNFANTTIVTPMQFLRELP